MARISGDTDGGDDGGGSHETLVYVSTANTPVLLDSWPVAEGRLIGVSVEITIGYDDGVFARGRTVYAHADARRRPGQATDQNGTSPLNDTGNAQGVGVTWGTDANALTLSIQTSYNGNVCVMWSTRLREGPLPST